MELRRSQHHTPKSSPMDAHIHIPKPCNENWNNMLPEDKGRHCLKCCKTVIDFTNWEAPEIAAYLNAHAGTEVCGRFRQEQLDEPIMETVKQIYYANLSVLKKIAAVFVIAFGLAASSCSPRPIDKTLGKIAATDSLQEKGKGNAADNMDEVHVIPGQIQYVCTIE